MLGRFCHTAVSQFYASAVDIDSGTWLEVRVGAQRTAEGRWLIFWPLLARLLRM